MRDKRENHHGDNVAFSGLAVLAWFLGPVRWVVQGNAGLSQGDLHTHSLAFKEYGIQFVLVVGAFNVLYLCSPYLGAMCLRLYRQVWQRCLAWNDGTKTLSQVKKKDDETLSA